MLSEVRTLKIQGRLPFVLKGISIGTTELSLWEALDIYAELLGLMFSLRKALSRIQPRL
jgi:hypothetical protein